MIFPCLNIACHQVPVTSAGAVVVGTGSAGYCAATRLLGAGYRDVLMIADKVRAGSSRNAGSDKQTYYKLSLAGDGGDSVYEMAETLFSGGAMDGDNALVEAALSAQCFLHLVGAGVAFPTDRYGQFIGYKTDHDPRERATSVGPYTSKQMTEQLEKIAKANQLPILDGCRVIDLVVDRSGEAPRVVGILVFNKSAEAAEAAKTNPAAQLLLIATSQVVYATGGPAGIYADSVFPHGQWGASGAALRAGARGKNLTEWQFGLASIAPRWNVSGSYMQVVPRFVSTDQDGNDEREFLAESLPDYGRQSSLVFLKGYQWPFDVRKALDGSSLIDLLVYRETVLRGRRVFLDFTKNPMGRDFDLAALDEAARQYLVRTGVAELPGSATPAERLCRLNQSAYDFYLERGPRVDLKTEYLEVAVCAQHNNGGLEVDCWWQSNLVGLFPIGEAAGAHGVYRPGGAALNSGQVGATRAAQWIANNPLAKPSEDDLLAAAEPVVANAMSLIGQATVRGEALLVNNAEQQAALNSELAEAELPETGGLVISATELNSKLAQTDEGERLVRLARQMSDAAGLVRNKAELEKFRDQIGLELADYEMNCLAIKDSRRSLDRLFLVRDILTTQYIYLSAMCDYLAHGGKSRGSVLYTDPAGELGLPDLPELFRCQLDGGALDDQAQIVQAEPSLVGRPEVSCTWRQIRPIPRSNEAFEPVWRQYLINMNVY